MREEGSRCQFHPWANFLSIGRILTWASSWHGVVSVCSRSPIFMSKVLLNKGDEEGGTWCHSGDFNHKLFVFYSVQQLSCWSNHRENGEFLLQWIFSKNIGKEVSADFTTMVALTNSSYAWMNNEYRKRLAAMHYPLVFPQQPGRPAFIKREQRLQNRNP